MRVKSTIFASIGAFFFMLSMSVVYSLSSDVDATKDDFIIFVIFFSVFQFFLSEARVTDIQYEKDKFIKNLLSEAIEQLNHDKSEYIDHRGERAPQPSTHN